MASQGEASAALEGDRVPVGVAGLGDSHPPILHLWGWAHHPLTDGRQTSPGNISSQNLTSPVGLSNQSVPFVTRVAHG